MSDTFPRQYARTQRFTLGEPRNLTVVADDTAVLFLRSATGSDPVNRLWKIDMESGAETLLADPAALLGADDDDLPAEERARRERARESAGGITAYATDASGSIAVFALAGRLWVTDTADAVTTELPVDGPVFDPRPSADGQRIAYVRGADLHVVDRTGATVAAHRRTRGPRLAHRVVGVGRLRCSRRDAPLPGPLVQPRRYVDRRLPSRRSRRAHLAHRRPGEPGDTTARNALPSGRDHEPAGRPLRVRTRRLGSTNSSRHRSRRAPLPRRGHLEHERSGRRWPDSRSATSEHGPSRCSDGRYHRRCR